MPDVEDLKKDIMIEAHHMRYLMHPGTTKMYEYLEGHFLWNIMKRVIIGFISKCWYTSRSRQNTRSPRDC